MKLLDNSSAQMKCYAFGKEKEKKVCITKW